MNCSRPRTFAYPVEEINKTHGREYQWKDKNLKPGDNPLNNVKGNLFGIDAEIDLRDADEAGFEINGSPIPYNDEEKRLTAGEGVDKYHDDRPEERSADIKELTICEIEPIWPETGYVILCMTAR